MIKHPKQYIELLSDSDIEKILQTSMDILTKKGMLIQSEAACELLGQAGAKFNANKEHIIFTEELIRESLKSCPPKFTVEARNSSRNVTIGDSTLTVTPGYGSAFIADVNGERKNATMEDFNNFVKLAYHFDVIDFTGGILVEPNDIPPRLRPVEITASLIQNSDKPFMGSVANSHGPDETLEMARIVFGDISKKHVLVSLININSPLRLDEMMVNSLIKYAQNNQVILLTPGILMGITSPVTTAGALSQAFAEILGALTLTQLINKGCPVIIGLGGFGSDLRSGGPGFGRPENSLATIVGSQIARKLGLPFRCSAAVTSSREVDCRSGYERMMTAMSAHNSGTHFCLQALGILDSINIMSYEQFVIDVEIWSYIKRLTQDISVSKDILDAEIVSFDSNSYMSSDQTIKYMRSELYDPELITSESYENWIESNGERDIVRKASKIVKEILNSDDAPLLPDDIRKELDKYINSRRKSLS